MKAVATLKTFNEMRAIWTRLFKLHRNFQGPPMRIRAHHDVCSMFIERQKLDDNWWLMLRKIQALKLTQTKRSKHKTPLISFLPLSHSDCRHLPWRHEPPTGMRQNYIYFITYVCAHIHQPKHVIRATICAQPSDTYDRELTRCSNFT